MKTVRGRRVRTNPRLMVRALDELDTGERVLLEDLRQDPDVFGIASVPSRGASLKAISRPMVNVLRALDCARQLSDDDVTAALLRDPTLLDRLILDDFIQVEDRGTFVGGPRALALITDGAAQERAEGPIGLLSDEALRYATRLAIRDPRALAWKLYSYNTAPQSPRWRARLRRLDAVVQYLEIGPASSLGGMLSGHWTAPELILDGAWWIWTEARTTASRDRGPLTAKLYVSPSLEALPAALRLAVPVLLDHGAPPFKIGVGLQHLLRPDKLVVYFRDRSHMLRCGADLVSALGALQAQGVPFTASVDGSALVSWGVDPPDWEHVLKWRERDSWRTWLTDRLARYLIAAAGVRAPCTPWEFATARLGLDGVDTRDWIPHSDLWRRAPASPMAVVN